MEQFDRDLWENFNMEFQIQSIIPSENKIIVSVDIQPEEASKLIKSIVLVNHFDSKVDSQYESNEYARPMISTTGNLLEEPVQDYYPSVLENNQNSIRRRSMQPLPLRMSTNFHASPQIIDYEWIPSGDSKYSLRLSWPRASCNDRDTYVLCLDNKDIQYIRETCEHDQYQIRIEYFTPGSQHHVEVLLRLSDGGRQRPFEPLDITVPESTSNLDRASMSLNDRVRLLDTIQSKNERESDRNSRRMSNTSLNKSKEVYQQITSQMEKRRMSERKIESLSCGCHQPHEYFPGIDHYLNSTNKRASSNISQMPRTSIDLNHVDHKHVHDQQWPTIETGEHDDDNDVIEGE